jgi:hypothetical protein
MDAPPNTCSAQEAAKCIEAETAFGTELLCHRNFFTKFFISENPCSNSCHIRNLGPSISYRRKFTH